MNILNEKFFKLSNTIFFYGLKPMPLAVYGYLVSCAGQKEKCWPSMKTIARCCGCSQNAARAAVDELVQRGFIRKVSTYKEDANGKRRQSNNTYYILDLPPLPRTTPLAEYRENPTDGEEINHQDADNKYKASVEGERRSA